MKNTIDYDLIEEIAKNNPKQLVFDTEKEYTDAIERAAKEIADNILTKKIVLITGPSASGKTTTSHILVNKLAELGITSAAIGMDDFYVNKEDRPLLPNGEPDFENITMLDVNRFKRCIDELIINKTTIMPEFDFTIGKRNDAARRLSIGDNTVIIIEGIHAFNPQIISKTMQGKFYKLYVHVNSDFIGANGSISRELLRKTRRIIRDYNTRGAAVVVTENMWQKVLEGEDLYIKPYMGDADIVINTTHWYEPFLYHDELVKIAKHDKDALKYLEYFTSNVKISKKLISPNALIWEFLTKPED